MSYRLKLDETVETGIKRVVLEQLASAQEELADRKLERHETVHQVRKRCKKIRGALRLVRPTLGQRYGEENAWYRDAARILSRLRDARAVIESCDALLEAKGDPFDREALLEVRRILMEREAGLTAAQSDLDEALAKVGRQLQQGAERVCQWSLEDHGFQALGAGLAVTYARARAALADARQDPSDARLHECRKRVKYHWYHTRLLHSIFPPLMTAWAAASSDLESLLGDDRDLAIVTGIVVAEADLFGDAERFAPLLADFAAHRVKLQAEAMELGRKLLAEKPKRLRRRWGRYWTLAGGEA